MPSSFTSNLRANLFSSSWHWLAEFLLANICFTIVFHSSHYPRRRRSTSTWIMRSLCHCVCMWVCVWVCVCMIKRKPLVAVTWNLTQY